MAEKIDDVPPVTQAHIQAAVTISIELVHIKRSRDQDGHMVTSVFTSVFEFEVLVLNDCWV